MNNEGSEMRGRKWLMRLVCVSLILNSQFSILNSAHGQTDLYNRYASQPGVTVASVSNFVLDSASRVDVTVVVAQDDSGWDWMKQEFLIPVLSPQQESELAQGLDAVLFARRNRANPKENAPVTDEKIDVSASCFIGISYLNRTLYIFCAQKEEQYDAIVALLVKKMMALPPAPLSQGRGGE